MGNKEATTWYLYMEIKLDAYTTHLELYKYNIVACIIYDDKLLIRVKIQSPYRNVTTILVQEPSTIKSQENYYYL